MRLEARGRPTACGLMLPISDKPRIGAALIPRLRGGGLFETRAHRSGHAAAVVTRPQDEGGRPRAGLARPHAEEHRSATGTSASTSTATLRCVSKREAAPTRAALLLRDGAAQANLPAPRLLRMRADEKSRSSDGVRHGAGGPALVESAHSKESCPGGTDMAQRKSLTVNGKAVAITIDDPEMPLLYALRDNLALNGPRFGCGLGQCGACTVHVDGKAVRSCVTSLSQVAAGQKIVTLEGLGSPQKPHPVQRAFIAEQAAQCGYCVNGMIMESAAFVARNKKPREAKDKDALANNLCRCGTHARIVKAVMRAASA